MSTTSKMKHLLMIGAKEIAPGPAFIEGRYSLHQYFGRYESTYTFDKRKMFFFKESIVYPYVQYMPTDKGGIIAANREKCDIIKFVQETGMSAL